MELQPNLTSIILELTRLSPLFTLKEESIYISSLLYLFQTPEQFTHSNVPLKVLKLLEHKYSICTLNNYNAPEATLINHEALHSLDPVRHPGMLFLHFSPNPVTTEWVKQSFSSHNNIITTTNLSQFRFSLEIIFTHLHTSKINTGSLVHESVIREFLSSSDLEERDQTSQFFISLSRIFQLFTPEALTLLLNSNRNGNVLLDSIITSLVMKHSHLYSSLTQCLVTLLDKLSYHIWDYTVGDLTYITSLIVSPCLLSTLEEWSVASDTSDSIPLGDVIFSWCEPFCSSIKYSQTATKQYKIIFKWLTYLSHYASTNSSHSYAQLTFIDVLLETLPQPSFLSSSSLACAVGCLFSKLLLKAFRDNLLDLLLSTKEDWLPMFLSIRTAFFNQQTAAVHSQLSFKYFQRDNRFNISTAQEDGTSHLNVFRLCHELIVKVFNSGLEYSLPSAESIVALCKQKQPINKVGTKIASLLRDLKDYHDRESTKPSILIDLVGDDVDSEIASDGPGFEEVYYTVFSTNRQNPTVTKSITNDSSIHSDKEGENKFMDELEFDLPSVNSPTSVYRAGAKNRDSDKKETSLINIETNVLVSTPDTTVPDSSDNIHSPPVIAPASLLSTVNSFMSEPTRDASFIIQNDELPIQELQEPYKAREIRNSNKEAKCAASANVRKRKHSLSESSRGEKRSFKIKIDFKHLKRIPGVNATNPISKESIVQQIQPHTSTPVNNNSNGISVLKIQRDVNTYNSTPLTSNNNKSKPCFDISSISLKIPSDLSADDNPTRLILDTSNVNNSLSKKSTESVFRENISTTSTQNYERLKEDLFLSQITPDEDESPIKKKAKEPSYTKSNPVSSFLIKRKKTNVTTMRPPFSRSRLTTMTEIAPESNVDYSKPATLYKDLKRPNKSHTASPPNVSPQPYPGNISVDLPEIDASLGEIRRMNDKAKLKLQPCKITKDPDNTTVQHKSDSKPTSSKKCAYTTRGPTTPIISKPTSKIPPEEHIDHILSWCPDIFLRDGTETRDTPPIHPPSPMPLFYKSFDEYKHLFSNCLLHEIFSNLSEEIERAGPIHYSEYSAASQQQSKEDKPIVAQFHVNTTPQNDASLIDFVKEQDLVLIKIRSRPPEPNNGVVLFGYINKAKVGKPYQHESKQFVSKVTLYIRYDTRHILSHFLHVFLKPLMSLTTYNRQWRGLINLYKSPICPHILYPSYRVCDPHPTSSTGKILIRNEHLFNDSQRRAITRIASMVSEPFICPRVALLLGPPGCGKSHTITGLLNTVLNMTSSDRKKQHILLCAPSNASADELALKLSEMSLISLNNKFGKIIRTILQETYGLDTRVNQEEFSSAEETISLIRLGQLDQVHPSVKPFHIDSLISSARHQYTSKMSINLKEQVGLKYKYEGDIKQLESSLQGLKLQYETFADDRTVKTDILETQLNIKSLHSKLTNVLRSISQLESIQQKSKLTDISIKESLLKHTNIILTTLSSSGISVMEELFKDRKLNHFSCVIVDEATQCNELDILIPLQFLSTKLVLVGDPNQLPAVVKSPQLQGNGFGRSLFERFDQFFNQDSNNEDPVIRLDTQYRMHPEICYFPNKTFYRGELRTSRRIEMRPNDLLNPYFLFHISYGQETSNKPGQIMNLKEIEFVSALVRELLRKFDSSSIGIITPYQAQLKELSKTISAFSERIEVNSVDGFQGKEKDIIIISCVRSKSKTGTIGFLSNSKRINVALTRAKKALYIVGDVDSLKRNITWNKLIQDAETRERLLTIDSSHIDASARQIWLRGDRKV